MFEMFYFSPWTWFGIVLLSLYVILVFCGFGKGKRKGRNQSYRKTESTVLRQNSTSEQSKEISQINRELRTKGKRFEDDPLSQARTRKDVSGLRQRFDDSSKRLVEETVEAVKSEGDLESQSYDFETVQSPANTVVTVDLRATKAELEFSSEHSIRERLVQAENRKSSSEQCKSDERPELQRQETSTRAFSSFAEEIVRNAKEDAFQQIDLKARKATVNGFAKKLSFQVLLEAFAEIRDDAFKGSVGQELHNKAKDMNSLNHGGAEFSTIKSVEVFADEFSEQVVSEGTDAFVTKEACIGRVKQYSENFANQIIVDGVAAAAIASQSSSNTSQLSGANKLGPEFSAGGGAVAEHAEHLTNQLCQLAYKEVSLSASLQSPVTGVVENLVNGAIFEAVTRVKKDAVDSGEEQEAMESDEDEILQSQVTNSGLIQSENKLDPGVISVIESVVSEAMNGVALSAESGTNAMIDTRVMNGHTEFSEPAIPAEDDMKLECSSDPHDSVCRRPPKESRESKGIDEKCEDDKESKDNGFWRQSLLLDLEEDVDFDDISSEASGLSASDELKNTTVTPDHDSSDEESEEFIDSSEDEIIDHAEEAKLGAVGGNSGSVAPPTPEWLDEEDFDDDDDDDDDEDEMFESQEAVDGLCMSRPNKHRKKSLPRPRVQSAGSHFSQAVVLDNGSGSIKLGLAGDKMPTVIQPAVVGTPQRYSLQMTGMDYKKHLKYGDVAMATAGVMHLDYPMSAGLIDNWTDVEDLWEYLLYENLGIEEGSHPILVTEVAENHKKNREKIGEILFEHLSVPAMYLANQLSLSLYASGLTTGVCLSSGFSVTQAAVIYEGHMLKHSINQLDIAGQKLTDNLKQLLRDNKGHNFTSSSGWQIVNSMKERLAYVSKDFAAEMKQYKTSAALTQYYKLPDGQMIDVSSEKIQSVEPLFAPSTLMSADDTVASQLPIHRLVHNAIARCDPEIQEMCYRNIVLSGGTTNVTGLVSRLEHELSRICPKVRKIRAPDNRHLSSWIGGSILSSLSTFDSMYVTVDEYAESGPRIVNQKCF